MTFTLPRAMASLVTVAVLTATLQTGTASALSVRVTDATDRPATVDVTSATYRNSEFATGVTVHVRDLRRTGKVVIRIGPPDTDIMYYVTVWIRGDGTVGKRLEYVTNLSRERRACAVRAAWSASRNYVGVSVPHSCLKFGEFLTVEWFQATMSVGLASDPAAGRDVGRGSSPGCATAGEIASLRPGHTVSRAHAILDTAGRLGDVGAGTFTRVYRDCAGGRGWFVEYDLDSRRVLDKGRVAA